MHRSEPSPVLVNAAAFVIVVAGMKAASGIITQFFLAAFLAVITTPLFFRLRKVGIPSIIALLMLILGLILIGWGSATIVGTSLGDLKANLPSYQQRLEVQVADIIHWIEAHGWPVPEEDILAGLNSTTLMKVVGNAVTSVSNLAGKAFVIFLVVAFCLLEAAMLPAKVRAMPGLSEDTWNQITRIVENIRRYMSMKTLMSLLTGLLIGFVLGIARIDYAILLGVLAFALNYIPTVGSLMAGVPGVLLALVDYGFVRAMVVTAAYVFINVLVSNVIEPRFMGKSLGLSPVIIIASLVFWGWILGPVGMLLSVPLTMAFKIALESVESTRGIALLLGSHPPEPDEATAP